MAEEEEWDVPGYDIDAITASVLAHGIQAVRSVAPMQAVPAAAYFSDELAMVLVLSRATDNALLDNVELAHRAADGRWEFGGSSGGEMAEWILDRPAVTHPDWNGRPLCSLGFQMQLPYGDPNRYVVGFTAMASRQVTTVDVTYGPHRVHLGVPESGLVVAAFPFHHVDDHVEYVAHGADGEVLATVTDTVPTDVDRAAQWPDPSLWH